MNKIKVFKSEALLAKAAADLIIAAHTAALKLNNRFTIALSGGNTPLDLYRLLATDAYSKLVNWKQVFVFWGDERCVPPDDPENNSYQAKQALLGQVPIPAENVFAVPIRMKPDQAASHYEQTLRSFFHGTPVFDCILLGMGDDGHTASLFPNTPILEEKLALVKAVDVPGKNSRVSFTAPLINSAKNILFLVSGKSKAPTLHIVLEGKKNTNTYPAQLIKGSRGSVVHWYLDKAAASSLKQF